MITSIFNGGNPNYSGLQQNLPASAGQIWTAGAQVRHNAQDSLAGTSNSLIIKIEFYNEPNGQYGTDAMLLETGSVVLNSASGLDTWLPRSHSATAPPGTVEARIALVFEQVGMAAGAALVDGVTLEPQDPPEACELMWSDEFDGSTVDPANWEFMIGDGTQYGLPSGWGNNELQYYTDRPENAYVADGSLHIVAREEFFAGFNYTSARLRTKNLQDFLYGRMEACIKLPAGQGLWSAFWMFPTHSAYGGWAASGELDIMEAVNTPVLIFGTIHYGGSYPNNTQSGGTFADGSVFSLDFHKYAVEWEPDEIRWYFDDTLYHTESSETWFSDNAPANPRAPFDQPFHFLLNVAVGGNFPGPPNGTANFPQEMVVDWVRVTAGPPFDCAEPCSADVNGDAEIDVQDLLQLLADWGPCTDCPADINADGTVNILDLLELLSGWGACP